LETSSDSSESDLEEISSDVITNPAKRRRLLEELNILTAEGRNGADGEPDDCDDEDGVPANSATFFASKNEIVAPSVVVPSITEVGAEEAIEEIGEVMSIVDSIAIVKSRHPERMRTIDTESLLVFDDRKVLGFVG
jgi:hypothetical protein